MTEAQEAWSVGVRAQVMTRDEATGGWMALGGGGLSHVMLRKTKVTPPDIEESTQPVTRPPQFEYSICGVRLSDDTEVLKCTIKKDFEYHKVMPTFHHWMTGKEKFGLTFQTAADARAFDRGVRKAVEQLLHGLGGSWSHQPAEPRADDEENNIFECLNLPSDSRSSSENSTASRPTRRTEDIQTPILTAIKLPSQHSPRYEETSLKQYATTSATVDDDRGIVESGVDDSSYVQLSAVHEYAYPQVGPGGVISSDSSSATTVQPTLTRIDSGSIKKASDCPTCVQYTPQPPPPPLPDKKMQKPEPIPAIPARLRCRHCHEWFLESANRPGACHFAPDCTKTCIDTVSCIRCAQCMLYHCMADSEGEFAMRPCRCGPPDEECTKRWLALSLLSVFVPCLCCYPPLRCVHRVAHSVHIVGGRHAPEPKPIIKPIQRRPGMPGRR